MRRIRLSTLMLLVVIVALSIALVVQQDRSARIESELRARLAQSWPLFLKQQREDERIRLYIEAIEQKRRAELAKRSKIEARQQERKDADINRQIEGMQQRYREEQAKRYEVEAQR